MLRHLFPPLLRVLGIGLLATTLCGPASNLRADEDAPAVITIGSAVTEIVYELGKAEVILGRDSTSVYPPEVLDLPDIGYMRALSSEGVLSVGPTLILASEGAGPPETIDVLKSTGIAYVEIPVGFTADAIARKIRIIGDALGVADRAATLSEQVRADVAEAQSNSAPEGKARRVMFLLSAAGGRLIAAGSNTAADSVIVLAGGVNAVEGYEGYKPITDEAVTAAAPEVIVMMSRSGQHAASADDLFDLPSLASTPAADSKSLLKIDGAKMLGFGPRTAEAVRELNAMLYGG